MSGAQGAREVSSTQMVFFDADFKTFRLYAGKTMYAFCITPELTLEHLYWGPSLPPGFDLRYLSQSARNAHFNTVEAPADRFGGRIVIGAETLEEVMKTYKESKTASKDESSAFYKRRLENYSWRIMNKVVQAQKPDILPPALREDEFWLTANKSYVNSLTGFNSSKNKENEEQEGSGRRRSYTNPPAPTRMNRRPSIDGFDSANASTASQPSFSKTNSPAKDTHAARFFGLKRNKSRQQLHQHRQTFERSTGKMGKGLLCCEYSDHGTGDFRSPSFMVVDNSNGSSISPLRYKRHAIYRGKLPMPDAMPAIRCHSEREASTLVVTMRTSSRASRWTSSMVSPNR